MAWVPIPGTNPVEYQWVGAGPANEPYPGTTVGGTTVTNKPDTTSPGMTYAASNSGYDPNSPENQAKGANRYYGYDTTDPYGIKADAEAKAAAAKKKADEEAAKATTTPAAATPATAAPRIGSAEWWRQRAGLKPSTQSAITAPATTTLIDIAKMSEEQRAAQAKAWEDAQKRLRALWFVGNPKVIKPKTYKKRNI